MGAPYTAELHRGGSFRRHLVATLFTWALVSFASAALGQDDVSRIDINHATQAELESLHGIGPAKAQSILRYIDENGPFEHPAEILRVPGIGQRTLEGFCSQIEVNGIAGCDESGVVDAPADVMLPSLSDDGRLNVNLASAEELQVLPRIGPALSQRIVDYRQTEGPFVSVEDLDNVSGIGPATLDQFRDFVTIQTNLNTATQEVFEALGIEADIAEQIVEYRADYGDFDEFDDLLQVHDVTDTLLDQVRPLFYVE